jgi:hypothetical protein
MAEADRTKVIRAIPNPIRLFIFRAPRNKLFANVFISHKSLAQVSRNVQHEKLLFVTK